MPSDMLTIVARGEIAHNEYLFTGGLYLQDRFEENETFGKLKMWLL